MRDIFRSFSIYGLGGILNRSIQFLLLPVYTRTLLSSEYGRLELVYIVANILAILYGLMISSGFLRVYYDNKDPHVRDAIFGSALHFTILASLIFGGSIIIFANPLADAIFAFDEGPAFLVLISISTILIVLGKLFYNLLMVRERAKTYIAFNALTLALQLGLTVYFVVSLEWGVKGVLYAQIAAHALETAVLAGLLVRPSMFRFSFSATREMLHFSVPLIPLQMAAFVVTLSDRFFLQGYRGLEEVGFYSLGYKFASIVPLLVIEPLKGCGPHIFKLINDPEKCKKMIADFTRYYAAAALLIGLAVAMLSREVIKAMANQSYHESYRIVFVLTIGYFFYGLYSLTAYAINIVKKNWIITLSWFVAALVNVVLNVVLVPKYGPGGAAFSSAISQAAVVAIMAYVVERVYPTHTKYRQILLLCLAACILYYISLSIDARILIAIPLKLVIIAVFAVGVLVSGYFSKEELARLRSMMETIWPNNKPKDPRPPMDMVVPGFDPEV